MTLQNVILDCLKKLGVTRAGTDDDSLRWSPSDLAKDLSDELMGYQILKIAIEEEREACLRHVEEDCKDVQFPGYDEPTYRETYTQIAIANAIRKRSK